MTHTTHIINLPHLASEQSEIFPATIAKHLGRKQEGLANANERVLSNATGEVVKIIDKCYRVG